MWFTLALIAGFLFAFNKLLVRASLSKAINPLAFGVVHEVFAGLLLLPIALMHIGWPQTPDTWSAFVIGIFLLFLADLFAFFSLRHTEASLYQIVSQLRHIVVLFGALLLLAEPIVLSKVLSIILIILGVSVALLENMKIKITRGIVYAFISTVAIATSFLFIKKAAVDVHPSFLASIGLIVSGILTYIVFLIISPKEKLIRKSTLKPIFIAAGIFALFELTSFTSLSLGEASRVTPVQQSSMIFTLIGGYLFLNERTHLKKKIIGSLLIASGIGLLYFV